MIAIISVTAKGDFIADKLSKKFPAVVYCKSKIEGFTLADITRKAFENNQSIIFISSTGIAVRAIAPFLKGKDKDPGIIVVDVGNNFTISLLSGHIGGANELTLKVAKILNNTPIITTATDNIGVMAPDIIAVKNNLIIDNLKNAKYIASLLVNGEKVYFKDDKNIISIPKGYLEENQVRENSIWITNKIASKELIDYSKLLRLIRKDIFLGVGCRKDTCGKKLIEFILSKLKENNIDYRAVSKVGSIDIKKDEQGIIDLCKYFNCEFVTFSKDKIKTVENKFEKSHFVYKTLGVGAVCEPSVDLLGGEIIVSKIKHDGMTLCIGEKINFN